MDEKLEQTLNRIETLLTKDKSSAKPKGWKGTAAYYKECYAKELSGFLDMLIANPTQDLFFSSKKFHRNSKTLVDRFNQAFLYLIDKMDTQEGKYKALREKIIIENERPFGCRISFHANKKVRKDVSVALEPEMVEKKTESLKWREELNTFIDTANDGDKFERKQLKLSAEDIEWVRESLVGLENVMHIIELEYNRIKIVKQKFSEQ